MKREVIPELLDSDAGTAREISDSLADLRMINRYFGGARAMTGMLAEVAQRKHLISRPWRAMLGQREEVRLRQCCWIARLRT